jgi:hypothetical protein
MTKIPLAALDLVPRSEGATIAEAVRNAIDLARHAERFGLRAVLVRGAPPQLRCPRRRHG